MANIYYFGYLSARLNDTSGKLTSIALNSPPPTALQNSLLQVCVMEFLRHYNLYGFK
jgi:hypothetical protein